MENTSRSVAELVALIQQGGHDDLMAKLWESVRSLVAFFARDYAQAVDCSRYGCETDDLIQCGYFAVLEALRGYDPGKGAFSTYLFHHCRHAFQECTGRTKRDRRDPLNRAASLDELLDDADPDGDSRYDLIPDHRDYIAAETDRIFTEQLHEALEKAIAKLAEDEADTIRRAYWKNTSLTEIAEQTGAEYNAVHAAYDRALRHLRSSKSRLELEAFIDQQTPFYRFGGLKQFQDTGTSGVEKIVILREGIRNRLEAGYIGKGDRATG